jgi:invasion protein IalB
MRPVVQEHGMHRLIRVAVVAGALAVGAGAVAQNGVAAWRVECTGDGKSLDCRAIQQLFHRESRQLLVGVLVRGSAGNPRGGPTAQVAIQLPLGLDLTEPVLIRVDNGPVDKQPIRTCTNTGCFAAFVASEKLVAQMRNGTLLKITVQDGGKKPIEMTLPLLGFSLAFDKARG